MADGRVIRSLTHIEKLYIQVQGVPIVMPVSVFDSPSYDLLLGSDALDLLEIVTDHKRQYWTINTERGVEPLDRHYNHTNYIRTLEVDNSYSEDDSSDVNDNSTDCDEYSSSEEESYYTNRSRSNESFLLVPVVSNANEVMLNEQMGPSKFNNAEEKGHNEVKVQKSTDEELKKAILQSVNDSGVEGIEKDKLLKLLYKYTEVFGLDYKDLKQTNILKFTIDTGDSKPIYKKPNRFMSHSELDSLKKEVQDMIANGQMIPTPGGAASGWAFPALYVKTKGGEKRLCVQFLDLNAVTVQDAWPLPNITDLLETYVGSKVFSTLDLLKGFNQIAVDDESIPKLTLSTPWGLFSYCVVPFGVKSGPSVFCRMIYLAMEKFLGYFVSTYIDDICTHSLTFDDHLVHLEKVLKRLKEVNLVLKPSKCIWCKKEVEVLGFVVSPTGIKPNKKNVEKIEEFPRPKNIKDVRAFIALAGFYRRHIQAFGDVVEPLTRLLKKNIKFKWEEIHEKSFESIKLSIVNAVELMYPNPGQRYKLYTDASDVGLGAVLTQVDENDEERPICFLSRKLVPAEMNYPTVEKELLDVVYALKKLRKYLLDKTFDLYTDNTAVRYLFKKNDVSQRLQRWILCVQEFGFQVHHLPGKQNVVADVMSRYPPPLNNESDYEDPFNNMYPALLVDPVIEDEYEEELAKLKSYLENPHVNQGNDKEDIMLRKKSVNYRVDESSRLFRLFRNERSVLIPKLKERQDIMKQIHNGHGHYGQEATWSRLYKNYWWPSAYQEVKEFVSSCHECQMFANVPKKVVLNGNVPLNHLFERFAIDYIGPFPATQFKNKYIILAVESYSRWPIAKAVKHADSRTTVDFMYNDLFTVFGASKFLLSDNGLHFTGKEVEEFLNMVKIKHQYAAAYHPQTNGMTESINGVIVKSVKKMVLEHKENWDVLLPTVLYAYRTKAHSIMKLSPYEVLFGVEAVGYDKDVLQQFGRRMENEIMVAMQERNGSQSFIVDYDYEKSVQNNEYDEAANPIKIGDKVLLLKHNRKNKLDTKYRRKLYTVVYTRSHNGYVLINDKGIQLKRSVNGSQLKKYHQRI